MIHLQNKFSCPNNCNPCDKCIEQNNEKEIIIIQSGDPLTNPEFPIEELTISLINKYPSSHILLKNTGRSINKSTLRNLIKCGLVNYQIVFFGYNLTSSQKITKDPASFDEFIRGVNYLLKYPTNIILDYRPEIKNSQDLKNVCNFIYEHFYNTALRINFTKEPPNINEIKKKLTEKNINLIHTENEAKYINLTYKNLFLLIKKNIENDYNLEVNQVTPVFGDQKNVSFLLNTKEGKFFFKIFNPVMDLLNRENLLKTPDGKKKYETKIKNDLNFTELLNKNKIAIPQAIKTKKGNLIIDFLNLKAAIFENINSGPKIRTKDFAIACVNSLKNYYSVTKKISLINKDKFSEKALTMLTELSSTLKKSNLKNKDSISKRIKNLSSFLHGKEYNSLKKCLLHGDAHLNNFLSENGKIRLIDIEFRIYGPLMYDVAIFIASLHKHLTTEEVNDIFEYIASKNELKDIDKKSVAFFIELKILSKLNAMLESNDSLDKVLEFQLNEVDKIKKYLNTQNQI